MFDVLGKMAKKVDKNLIDNYLGLYNKLRSMIDSGDLPSHPINYLEKSDLAQSIYERKYYLKDASGNTIESKPEHVFARVASFVAAVESENTEQHAIKFYNFLYNGYFVPGGRVLAGAGDLYRLKTLANCFVSGIRDDSIESIFQTAYEAARTYSYGGGIGIDVSVLRPAGSIVHNASNFSTGSVSFMSLYSLVTELIGQDGRRGALMLSLNVKHPDIFRFIHVKKTPSWTTNQIVGQCKSSGLFNDVQLSEIERRVRENIQVRFANISIKVTDEFMLAVEEQNRYGPNKILVYLKSDAVVWSAPQITNEYSLDIPSKDISNYELAFVFNDLDELNAHFEKEYGITISDLDDVSKRDVCGDYIVQTDNKTFAIKYSGDFLLYFASDTVGEIKQLVKARDIWDLFIEGNYSTAEPGLMFWSTMSKESPSNYLGKPIIGTNPCSEVPLEDGGACNLGSINLSRMVKNGFTPAAEIDWDLLGDVVDVLVRFLDDVVSWNAILNPLEKQRVAALQMRRVGMGVMGIADMFYQLGLDYDSTDAIELLEKIMSFIANRAYQQSALLAKEKGSFPMFDYDKYSEGYFFNRSLTDDTKSMIEKYGLRNVALLAIAPTGTISNIALSFVKDGVFYIGVSGGVEPVFSISYKRRFENANNKMFNVFHSTVQAYIDMFGLTDDARSADEAKLHKLLPSFFFRTAHNIDPKMRVQIQGAIQKYVDHSISSTVNLPEDVHPEIISEIYLEAWKHGLKGLTVYRNGSRYPILFTEEKQTEFQSFKNKKFKIKTRDSELVVSGDDVIRLPSGLTTVYHAIKDNKIKPRGVEVIKHA